LFQPNPPETGSTGVVPVLGKPEDGITGNIEDVPAPVINGVPEVVVTGATGPVTPLPVWA
jgi:hypothetical protein